MRFPEPLDRVRLPYRVPIPGGDGNVSFCVVAVAVAGLQGFGDSQVTWNFEYEIVLHFYDFNASSTLASLYSLLSYEQSVDSEGCFCLQLLPLHGQCLSC